MKAPEELLEIVEGIVRQASQRGADEAEAFIKETRRVRISRHGRLAQPSESHMVGIGVRVIIDGAIGTASSAGLHRVDTILDNAFASVEEAQPRPGFPGLPRPGHMHDPTPVPDAIMHPDVEHLHDANQAVFDSLDDERTEFASVGVSVGASRFAVANSHGLATWDQGGRQTVDIELRVGDGGRRVTAWDNRSSTASLRISEDLVPTAEDAQRRALGALSPQPLPRPIHKAVLAPSAVAQLFTAFLRTFNGNLVASGSSPISGRLGTEVGSPLVTIHDVPRPHDAPPRSRSDHEGVLPQNLALLSEGVARQTFDDTISGIAHTGSNGHGTRKGWSGSVIPGLLMPEMRRGDTPYARLIEEADAAVLIEEPLTGMLTASLETGQFSAVLPYAYYIEGGEIRHALPNLTVSGNVVDVVAAVEAVEDRVHETQIGHFPAVRTGGLTCAT